MSDITRDGLLASAENESTYFMDLNSKCTRFGTSYAYCIVENYDLCFYPHRVSDILGRRVEGVPCDGKANVLKLYSLVSSKPEYDKYTIRYFVDADFDDNSCIDSHIYVTTCYSIENLFLQEDVVSKILENEYKIRPHGGDGKHSLCLALFRNELAQFHIAVMPYNSWYRSVKRRGLTKEMKVCLGESVPTEMLDLKIGAITSKYNLEWLKIKYPLAPVPTQKEIDESTAFLISSPMFMRGKFEIQFLHKFFEFINADAKGPKRYAVISKGLFIDRPRMISAFEKYVSTPPDMREYILHGVRGVI